MKKKKNQIIAVILASNILFQSIAPTFVLASEGVDEPDYGVEVNENNSILSEEDNNGISDESLNEEGLTEDNTDITENNTDGVLNENNTKTTEDNKEEKKFSGKLKAEWEEGVNGDKKVIDEEFTDMTGAELKEYIRKKVESMSALMFIGVGRPFWGIELTPNDFLDDDKLEKFLNENDGTLYIKAGLTNPDFVNSDEYNPEHKDFKNVAVFYRDNNMTMPTQYIYDDTLEMGKKVVEDEGINFPFNVYLEDFIYGEDKSTNKRLVKKATVSPRIIRVGVKKREDTEKYNKDGFQIIATNSENYIVNASAVPDPNKRASKIVIRTDPRYVEYISGYTDKKNIKKWEEADEENNSQLVGYLTDNNVDKSFTFEIDYILNRKTLPNKHKVPIYAELYAKDGTLLSRSETVYDEYTFEKPQHTIGIRQSAGWYDGEETDIVTDYNYIESKFIDAGKTDENDTHIIKPYPVEFIIAQSLRETGMVDGNYNIFDEFQDSSTSVDTDRREMKSVEQRVYLPEYRVYNKDGDYSEDYELDYDDFAPDYYDPDEDSKIGKYNGFRRADFIPELSKGWKLSEDGTYVYKITNFDEGQTINNVYSNGRLQTVKDKNGYTQVDGFPHFEFPNAALNLNIVAYSEVIRTFAHEGEEDDIRKTSDAVKFQLTSDTKKGDLVVTDINNPNYDYDNNTAYFYDSYIPNSNKNRDAVFEWKLGAKYSKKAGYKADSVEKLVFNNNNLDERMKFTGVKFNEYGEYDFEVKLYDENDKLLKEEKLHKNEGDKKVVYDIPKDLQEEVKRVEVIFDNINMKASEYTLDVYTLTRLKDPKQDFGDNANFVNESEFIYTLDDGEIINAWDRDNVVMVEVRRKAEVDVGGTYGIYYGDDYSPIEGGDGKIHYEHVPYFNYYMTLNGLQGDVVNNFKYVALLPYESELIEYEPSEEFLRGERKYNHNEHGFNPDDYVLKKIFENPKAEVIKDYKGTGRTAVVLTADKAVFSDEKNFIDLLKVFHNPKPHNVDKITSDGYLDFDEIGKYKSEKFIKDDKINPNKEILKDSFSTAVLRRQGIYGNVFVKDKSEDVWEKVLTKEHGKYNVYQFSISEENHSREEIKNFELINVFPYKGDRHLINENFKRGSTSCPIINGVELSGYTSYKIDYEFLSLSREEFEEYNHNVNYEDLVTKYEWSKEIPKCSDGRVILMRMYTKDGDVIMPGEKVEALVDFKLDTKEDVVLRNTFVRRDSTTDMKWLESDAAELRVLKPSKNLNVIKAFTYNNNDYDDYYMVRVDNDNNTGIETEVIFKDEQGNILETGKTDSNGVYMTKNEYDIRKSYTFKTKEKTVNTKPIKGKEKPDTVKAELIYTDGTSEIITLDKKNDYKINKKTDKEVKEVKELNNEGYVFTYVIKEGYNKEGYNMVLILMINDELYEPETYFMRYKFTPHTGITSFK